MEKNQLTQDTKLRYCKKCKKKTEHLLCGFGTPNSFIGNARYRCLNCKEEGL